MVEKLLRRGGVIDRLWRMPTEWVGALALVLAGRDVEIREHGTVKLAYGPGVGRLFDRLSRPGWIGAMTLGRVVLARDAEIGERMWGHELVHVRQAAALGPLFLPAYGLASLQALLRGGDAYLDNRYEVEARRYEQLAREW